MRTTIRLDDDALRAARSLARAENKTLGEVISDLIRRALAPKPSARRRRGEFPTFEVSREAKSITPEMVREAMEED